MLILFLWQQRHYDRDTQIQEIEKNNPEVFHCEVNIRTLSD